MTDEELRCRGTELGNSCFLAIDGDHRAHPSIPFSSYQASGGYNESELTGPFMLTVDGIREAMQ